ncbi:MAG TPA: Stk1 family PASTA domain-containing Ser/Thr kinase [Candidatus Avanaerovorax faecigallinarum]|nr:Stk1 family PASTA domain-containing Ser/Thr kinase [Candidatus Avanaerovorax faecigallinarum]
MSKLLAGRYELVEKIGEGGMAVVYKGRDRLLNRYIAVKILRPEFTKDAQFIESFNRESQAAAGLQHPNIVGVYDVGAEGSIHFIVMELVDGRPLSDIIAEKGPLNYKTAIEIAKQVASALSLAHKHNIVHRDVKPHNIMITTDGMAKLTDFGIARAVSSSTMVAETSKVIGSVHYFSPEQARGSYVDERSDIYSLGIVLYEMLTGKVPFDGENPVQVALMHINNEMTPPSKLVAGIPPALEQIVMKATDKYQSNRYATADEMLSDLSNLEFISSRVGDSVFAGAGKSSTMVNIPVRTEDNNDEELAKIVGESGKTQKKSAKKNSSEGGGKGKKIAIGIVAAVVVIAAVVGGMYALGFIGGKADVEIPSVIDMTYEEAKDELEAAGLKIEMGEEVETEDKEPGVVVSQSPKEGVKVKEGTTVTVDISISAEGELVPNLLGEVYDKSTVEKILEEHGFTLGTVTEDYSAEYEKGYIMGQDPGPGTEADKDTAVNIVVSQGKAKPKMPLLLGLTVDQAEAALADQGLVLGIPKYAESNLYEPGQVMEQQYPQGTELDAGTTVDIVIAKSPSGGTSGETGGESGGEPSEETDGGDSGDSGEQNGGTETNEAEDSGASASA